MQFFSIYKCSVFIITTALAGFNTKKTTIAGKKKALMLFFYARYYIWVGLMKLTDKTLICSRCNKMPLSMAKVNISQDGWMYIYWTTTKGISCGTVKSDWIQQMSFYFIALELASFNDTEREWKIHKQIQNFQGYFLFHFLSLCALSSFSQPNYDPLHDYMCVCKVSCITKLSFSLYLEIYPIFAILFFFFFFSLYRLFALNEDLSTSFEFAFPFPYSSPTKKKNTHDGMENETITRFLEMKVKKITNEQTKNKIKTLMVYKYSMLNIMSKSLFAALSLLLILYLCVHTQIEEISVLFSNEAFVWLLFNDLSLLLLFNENARWLQSWKIEWEKILCIWTLCA